MPLIIPEQVNEGGVRVGEEWFNFSKPRGKNPGYQGPELVVGQQYEVELNPWTAKDGTELTFISSAKSVGEAIAQAPSPYNAAHEAAAQRVTAQRDPTRASIERQVALKAAVEIWSGTPAVSIDNTLAYAAAFYTWLRNENGEEPAG